MKKPTPLRNDPLWYKDAVIYELHVKAFHDSNGDGIGDFKGLTRRLDYLQGLGVTAIWLLPFYPSPLKDDGYDIADYFDIHPDYGTLKDFREFLEEAHRRGLRVITELVLNHTSREHVWFQRARRAKENSRQRGFYVWSDSADTYKDARIIFKDFETSNWAWDPLAKAYYWHRFYSHQPDLNYDSALLQKEMLRAIDYWLDMGVDGLRLDAVPYLFERDGTNCENLPETHAYLKKLRAHVDSRYKDRMLLAEANQWPEDAAVYLGQADECHMAFHFPLMPRMFMAIQMEDSFPIIDILKVTPAVPEICQWAIFLRNHDELTLEMVTDEERDYMYRVFAQDPKAKINLGIRRRLAPLLGNNRRKIELMNILLLSLPGTPVIYYGDELGMGDNYYLGDRDGVRTPMQWSPDRNAGFSQTNPQKLYLPVIIEPEYHYEALNVENQEGNLSSLLWWMKRVIAMRKRFVSFSRGSMEMLSSTNPRVFSFIRRHNDEVVLVVINLSRFSQVVDLELPGYEGFVPEEVFSQNSFPVIEKRPYVLTLGPYNHFWLLLKKKDIAGVQPKDGIPQLDAEKNWESVLQGSGRDRFEEQVLPGYVKRCRWFGAKSRTIRKVKIIEDALVSWESSNFHLLLLEISYNAGTPEVYFLPLAFNWKEEMAQTLERFPQAAIAELLFAGSGGKTGVLYDAIYDQRFHASALSTIANRKKIKGIRGEFTAASSRELKRRLAQEGAGLTSQPLQAEQSNSSILYEKKFICKLYRRLDEGINPELEILRNLSQATAFLNIPPFLGAIEYRMDNRREPLTVALLQGFIENAADAWGYTVDTAGAYFERILAKKSEVKPAPSEAGSILDIDIAGAAPLIRDFIGSMFWEMVSLLGRRTAELHLAMASLSQSEDFAPEAFSLLYQKSVYKSMQGLTSKVMHSLKESLGSIPESIRKEAEFVLNSEKNILIRLQKIMQKKISATKIRIHGDYHLGQVLYTGKDFVIIDFEGEPARNLSERRLKRSPFRDVAGMVRSFHYAAYAALFLRKSVRPEDVSFLEGWIEPWYRYVSALFLRSYLDTVGSADFVPQDKQERKVLLEAFLLEKAVYELGYELDNRPDWVIIPVRGMEYILKNIS